MNLTQWSRRKIVVELSELIGLDSPGFVGLLSGRAFGKDIVTEVSYAVTGVTDDGELVIEVSGYIWSSKSRANAAIQRSADSMTESKTKRGYGNTI